MNNLPSLLPPKVDYSRRDAKRTERAKVRARLMAQEFTRNNGRIREAFETVTGLKGRPNQTLNEMVSGQIDTFIEELQGCLDASQIDKANILNTLYHAVNASLLDYFNDDGMMMTVKEMKKLPRIYQKLITKLDVKTAEFIQKDKNGNPLTDDNGNVVKTTVQEVKIELLKKESAIQQIAAIMKWTLPSVVISNQTNIAVIMQQSDERRRRMQKNIGTVTSKIE